jgi:hypothetical protein
MPDRQTTGRQERGVYTPAPPPPSGRQGGEYRPMSFREDDKGKIKKRWGKYEIKIKGKIGISDRSIV